MTLLSNLGVIKNKAGLKVGDNINSAATGFINSTLAPQPNLYSHSVDTYRGLLGQMYDDALAAKAGSMPAQPAPTPSVTLPTLTEKQKKAGSKIEYIGGKPVLYVAEGDLENRKKYGNIQAGYVSLGDSKWQ